MYAPDNHWIQFHVSLYPLSFFANTPFKVSRAGPSWYQHVLWLYIFRDKALISISTTLEFSAKEELNSWDVQNYRLLLDLHIHNFQKFWALQHLFNVYIKQTRGISLGISLLSIQHSSLKYSSSNIWYILLELYRLVIITL